MRRLPTSTKRPSLLLIDAKKFREAGIVRLLSEWADAEGLTIKTAGSDKPLGTCAKSANYEMVILDVCGEALSRPQQQALMREVRESLPRAELIIISDNEDVKEACSAFRAGAAGFLPSSIDPSVAMNALSFIRAGGSFFPPSILTQARRSAPISAREAPYSTRYLRDGLSSRSPQFSSQQEHVLRLLRQGLSNKEIARRLHIAEATVKVHVRCIMRKLGVVNRTQAAIATLDRARSRPATSR